VRGLSAVPATASVTATQVLHYPALRHHGNRLVPEAITAATSLKGVSSRRTPAARGCGGTLRALDPDARLLWLPAAAPVPVYVPAGFMLMSGYQRRLIQLHALYHC
jgi:hypothetical protein